MRRLLAMIVKEAWAVLRDPKARMTLIIPPIFQLVLFSYATTLEVKHVDVGVLDRSGGARAAEFISHVTGSPTFRSVRRYTSMAQVRAAIDDQKILAALVIDSDFDGQMARGRPVTVGVILDGRRGNAAQIVAGYLNVIATTAGIAMAPGDVIGAEAVIVTNWYNPALDYVWFTLPSLAAMIVMVGALALTSQSVARERELGTFDQLMVSPLRVHEILIGKAVPPWLIGIANGLLYLILAPLVFGVPFIGSIPLFLFGLAIYSLSLVGIGLFISALCNSQQQAFLGSFVVILPITLLSGYASPVENMSAPLQLISRADPLRYFLVISQGLFLKDLPAWAVLDQIWPLALIAAITLSAAAWLFRARME